MGAHGFDTSTYTAEDIKPDIEAQLQLAAQQQNPRHTHHHRLPPHQQQAPQIQPQPSNFMAAFQQSPPQHPHAANGYQHAGPSVMAAAAAVGGYQQHAQHLNAGSPGPGPAAWREWTDNVVMPGVMEGQNVGYHHPSMTPGAPIMSPDGGAAHANAMVGMPMDGTTNSQWPLCMYTPPGPGMEGQ